MTVESVIHDVLSLPIPKRLEILSKIAYSVQEREPTPIPEPKTISLTEQERERLKKIFVQSLATNDLSIDDLVEVSPALLEYIESAFIEVEYKLLPSATLRREFSVALSCQID